MTTLVKLPLTALWSLMWTLFCPVLIGAAAYLVFGPGSFSYGVMSFVCFAWGAIRVQEWWVRMNALLATVAQPPRPPVAYRAR